MYVTIRHGLPSETATQPRVHLTDKQVLALAAQRLHVPRKALSNLSGKRPAAQPLTEDAGKKRQRDSDSASTGATGAAGGAGAPGSQAGLAPQVHANAPRGPRSNRAGGRARDHGRGRNQGVFPPPPAVPRRTDPLQPRNLEREYRAPAGCRLKDLTLAATGVDISVEEAIRRGLAGHCVICDQPMHADVFRCPAIRHRDEHYRVHYDRGLYLKAVRNVRGDLNALPYEQRRRLAPPRANYEPPRAN